MNKTLVRVTFAAALAVLFLAPAAWSFNINIPFLGKKASAEEKTSLAQTFEGKYAVPKADLPRGTYQQRGAVVDFAELERLRLMNGAGPRVGSVMQIAQATAKGQRLTVLFREPNKRPDPRGLAVVLRPAKGEDFAAFVDAENIREILSKMFDLSDALPSPAPPSAPAVAAAAYSTPPVPATPASAPAPSKPEAPKAALEIGMAKKAVIDTLGEPRKRDVEFEGDVVVERLFYEFSDHTSLLLILRDGMVEQIKRF